MVSSFYRWESEVFHLTKGETCTHRKKKEGSQPGRQAGRNEPRNENKNSRIRSSLDTRVWENLGR